MPFGCVEPSGLVEQSGHVEPSGHVGLSGLVPTLMGWFGCLTTYVGNDLSGLLGFFSYFNR